MFTPFERKSMHVSQLDSSDIPILSYSIEILEVIFSRSFFHTNNPSDSFSIKSLYSFMKLKISSLVSLSFFPIYNSTLISLKLATVVILMPECPIYVLIQLELDGFTFLNLPVSFLKTGKASLQNFILFF